MDGRRANTRRRLRSRFELPCGRIKIRLAAPPVDGKANEALVEFLAGEYGVPKRNVTIESGLSSRQKRVSIWRPGK